MIGFKIFGGVIDGYIFAVQFRAEGIFHVHRAYGSNLRVELVKGNLLSGYGAGRAVGRLLNQFYVAL